MLESVNEAMKLIARAKAHLELLLEGSFEVEINKSTVITDTLVLLDAAVDKLAES